MKLSDITEEFEGLNEAPPGGFNPKASLDRADNKLRTGAVGNWLSKLNKAVNKKYASNYQIDPNVPDGGIDHGKDIDAYVKGKDFDKPAKEKPAPKAEPAPAPTKPQPIKDVGKLKPGSAFNDGNTTWQWDGTQWSDGKNTQDPQTGLKQFNKALAKGQAMVKEKETNPYFNPSISEAPPGVGMLKKAAGKVAQKGANMAVGAVAKAAGATPDEVKAAAQQQGGLAGKVAGMAGGADTQKVAQKATALKGVTGSTASGAQVAKGLDKVAQGQTVPPNVLKAISPYAQSIMTIMQDPQLMGKFKQLMKQANKGGQQ